MAPPKAIQAHREASFHCSLEDDILLLNEMFAREKVSGLFEYQIVVSSEDENIDLNQLVGQDARVELLDQNDEKREFCGIVSEMTFASFRDNFAEYRLVLRPWLWLLTQASNNRIFQPTPREPNNTVPDIIRKVCSEHGFTDIKNQLGRTYESRVYCVQYRESDFDFLSRLMEEEGIHYFFEHEKGKHHLILADDLTCHVDAPGYANVPYFPPDQNNKRDGEHMIDWRVSRSVRPGTFRLEDYDFVKPGSELEVKSTMEKSHKYALMERYEYPGRYESPKPRGELLASIRLQEAQSDHEVMRGRGNVRGLIPGFLFKLKKYPREDQNQKYLTLEVTHRLALGGYDSGGADVHNTFEYDCAVTVVPDSVDYRPPRLTPKPFVQGPQTAVVVGQSGEEIHTDQYGRIKVQFHWDRDGKRDQDSSCWVRVSQAWAGKTWGAQFIPRIGQEVIVEFLEGDPDRPIVTGSVYNASNMPPYALPANKTQSGIKTRSTKGGTASNFNEIRFEDKKGEEELYLHAEKAMKVEVEEDRFKNVGRDETDTIERNRTHTVKGVDTQDVKEEQNITVGKKRTLTCEDEEERKIEKASKQTIKGKWTTKAYQGVEIESPVDIEIKSGTTIKLNAPEIIRTDESWISTTDRSLAFVGAEIQFSGVTVDLKGNATGIFASNIALSGLNIAVNLMNIGYNHFDLSTNGVDLGEKLVDHKKALLAKRNAAMELRQNSLSLTKGTLSVQKASLWILI